MGKKVGIRMIEAYKKVIDDIANKKLTLYRAKMSAVAIEKKAWELLENPDLYKRKSKKERELAKIQDLITKYTVGGCDGTPSPHHTATQEAIKTIEKEAWEKVGRVDLYEKETALLQEEEDLREKRRLLNAEIGNYKNRNGSYNSRLPFDIVYTELKDKLNTRVWELLGQENLHLKAHKIEEELQQIATEEKKYNGGACELRRKVTSEHYYGTAPKGQTTPLEEARWQAKELLYPEEADILAEKENIYHQILMAGLPEEIGKILQEGEQRLDMLVK